MALSPRREGARDIVETTPASSVPVTGTVTILFTDIRGFTDYTEQYGDEAAYRVLRDHAALVREQTTSFGGTVVKSQGDSFMVSFSTARGAILCAIAIQRVIGERAEGEHGPRIAIGVGINTGEPIEEGGDYFGSMVNLAARICATAGPGEILVAESTRYVAGRIEGVEYVDRGLRELKGFQEPQRLSEVRWGGTEPQEIVAEAGGETRADTGLVHEAIALLNRVLAVSHLDDPAFRPLLECQARATDLRLALSRAVTEGHALSTQRVRGAIQPYGDLIALIVDRDRLGERRWADLEASVASVFGRQLVSAVARGRLSGGSLQEPAEPQPVPHASSDGVATVPMPDPRAAEVRWWTIAHRAWGEWKASGVAFAHVLRSLLSQHPHLLSVPIRESADQGSGTLAAGYLLLLEHVERQSPSFLVNAVERSLEATGGGLTRETLGAKLYEAMVADGRLRKTYEDFVREVLVVAIPNPGVWADAGVVEHEGATLVMTRPGSAVGDVRENERRLTEERDRTVERLFTLTVLPLTTRFVYVRRGDLRSPRDVEIKLTRGGEPSDQAWYVRLRTGLAVSSEPQRLLARGVALPGLGQDHFGAWVAVFNPDPDAAAPYELSLTVKPSSSPGRRAILRGRSPRRP